jgi:hypothetical protein
MQEEQAYEEGYRDGLRFLFAAPVNVANIPKEIWVVIAEELQITNKLIKKLQEDERNGRHSD